MDSREESDEGGPGGGVAGRVDLAKFALSTKTAASKIRKNPMKPRFCALVSGLQLLPARSANMKNSTKDQVTGKVHELKGAAIEKAGDVINDPNVQQKGLNEKVAGKVQKKVGEIEKVLGQ
jgi:uncharacterized protein YjbJ (UPF0337 family)